MGVVGCDSVMFCASSVLSHTPSPPALLCSSSPPPTEQPTADTLHCVCQVLNWRVIQPQWPSRPVIRRQAGSRGVAGTESPILTQQGHAPCLVSNKREGRSGWVNCVWWSCDLLQHTVLTRAYLYVCEVEGFTVVVWQLAALLHDSLIITVQYLISSLII